MSSEFIVTPSLRDVELHDKYTLEQGHIYASGTQALVRLPMMQQLRDQRAGLNTAGYISGYRGSPLGGVDMALWAAKKEMAQKNIVFQPGLNEDLAATAVWGTQQTNLYDGARYDGVFGMWYGKGPGVDRSADVLKHANSAGTSRHGGVLMLAGDDHAAKSSSIAHQSEHILIACGIPVLYPANVQEYLDFGLHGWAMSRYSGLWVGMKCVTDVVESSASLEVDPDRVNILLPDDFQMPEGGLNIRWPDTPLDQEVRMLNYKWYAALEYIRANKLNRVVLDSPKARFGIMAAGKAYLDLRQALVDLGLDDDTCRQLGIRIMKVGCVWPLDARDSRAFAEGLEEILVVEEKRQILEYALKEELYNWREDVRPRVYGKFDERDNAGGEWSQPRGNWLLPARYELSPAIIAKAIASRLTRMPLSDEVRARILSRIDIIEGKERAAEQTGMPVERKPWFCSGCPHNTSTKVPEGSRALAGIGCHYMAMWMDRNTETFSQMGGEGVSWLGQMHFTSDKHVFVNLGDGTYFHSGLLAIRAAVAASANMTYKILFNDAVAMTGGQPVDGVLTVPQIVEQLKAEAVAEILVVSDEPEKYRGSYAVSVPVHHRDELEAIQLRLRDTAGVTVIVYDQTCATEKRRRRKRGLMVDVKRRAYINPAVCEGCGDCSVASGCVSVEPLETPLGTKRQINQNSCNKDFSCLKGFCPSFVTIEGGELRRPEGKAGARDILGDIPDPVLPSLEQPFGVVVAGIGGTGVVTIGALMGMAAHLESKGITVLDQTGLAQKGGAVMSHIQIAARPEDIHATRIAVAETATLIGCDEIVAASNDVLSRVKGGLTKAVINTALTPAAEFLSNPDWKFPKTTAEGNIQQALGDDCDYIDATSLAETVMGDSIFANPLMLGYAWQKGWVPLSYQALIRAIELNGVAVDKNIDAFEWGRVAAHDRGLLPEVESDTRAVQWVEPETLDDVVARGVALLTEYQDEGYAKRYTDAVEKVRCAEDKVAPNRGAPLSIAVARNLMKLMAYKDEYEVARLHASPVFQQQLEQQFAGKPGKDYQVHFHMAPPLISKKDANGHLIKRRFGPWMLPMFKLLAKMKFLRGSVLDVFSHTDERRQERQWINDYLAFVDEVSHSLTRERLEIAIARAEVPQNIRGFGHVKERNMVAARTRWQVLKQDYDGKA
ncbi:indolepyruvate ferredoxin oxidoreductase family protein [Spongiibacter sp. KMU-166]|uniref:Indolepyruvate ferredoxin oxidoreductase family protein n=1 Tax=Spongiibacter thalassae TaxID=2721624 RepID=A0ABX1GB77_9GAMM|nr:indolepyruvate ferredoxin oxidoreductase family protein [Spongiibacter thalassae]NKI16427.1 indolepyruvate ferredoxin oxidoreductase family protein [Spongiibacter thalassae]